MIFCASIPIRPSRRFARRFPRCCADAPGTRGSYARSKRRQSGCAPPARRRHGVQSHAGSGMSRTETGVRGYLEIPERLNLGSYVVDRHVEQGRGARVAAWAEGRAYTFAELCALTNRFANALRALGVGRGDRVMLRLGTSLNTLIAILGTIKAGAVVLPTSFLLRAREGSENLI